MNITVTHLLEDETKLCIQFSSTHATWVANDKSDAIVGAATMIGMGFPTIHFFDQVTKAWLIQTYFWG